MYPSIPEHRFGAQGEYLVRRYTRGGQRRILQNVALSLSLDGVTPDLVQALDGDNRYWECVLRECLVEAPPHWWEQPPPQPGRNGTPPAPVLTFEYVPMDEFLDVIEEAGQWFESFRRPVTPRQSAPGPGAAEPEPVGTAEDVSPAFRGRAT